MPNLKENQLIWEAYSTKTSEIKDGAFLIKPNGVILDVSSYESHGIGALVVIDGYDEEDVSFEEGEDYIAELRSRGYATGWYNPGESMFLTLFSLDCVKKAKRALLNTMEDTSTKNINIDVVNNKDEPLRSISKGIEWLQSL
jgi:hypothetical protein